MWVTGVQTCALPIYAEAGAASRAADLGRGYPVVAVQLEPEPFLCLVWPWWPERRRWAAAMDSDLQCRVPIWCIPGRSRGLCPHSPLGGARLVMASLSPSLFCSWWLDWRHMEFTMLPMLSVRLSLYYCDSAKVATRLRLLSLLNSDRE